MTDTVHGHSAAFIKAPFGHFKNIEDAIAWASEKARTAGIVKVYVIDNTTRTHD